MKIKIGKSDLEIIPGKIEKQDTEAIVNAANRKLAPGGGVSGAIHSEAGPKLWEECKNIGSCEEGEAKITEGFELKADYVIHTVGPVYEKDSENSKILENCYKNCLEIAEKNDIESISFPSISTGSFGYPIKEAGEIALNSITKYLERGSKINLVRIVLFNSQDFDTYQEILENLKK